MTVPGLLRGVLDSRALLWLALAAPGLWAVASWAAGAAPYGAVVSHTGTWAAALLLPTVATTPLGALFPRSRWVAWLLRRRLDLGGACLAYAVLHAAAHVAGQGHLRVALREAAQSWIGAGWLALGIFVAYAAVRRGPRGDALRAAWPRMHRITYAGAALVALHWALVAFDPLIARVQRSLHAYGYYDGPIDGIVGPLSRDALRRFQRDHGLPVTGRITPETLEIVGIVPN